MINKIRFLRDMFLLIFRWRGRGKDRKVETAMRHKHHLQVAEPWSGNQELWKMNLRMNTEMFSNYNLCFITLRKMSMLKSFLS